MKPTTKATTLGAALLFGLLSSALAQSSWQTVADFQCDTPATVDALAKDSAGNLYAAISTSDAKGRMHAVIRKSSDHGVTWTVVEDYVHPDQSATRYLSLGVDTNDSQYAVGHTEDKDQQTRWIVRKSGRGGNSWSTVDDFSLPGGQTTVAQGFAVDVAGNLYVAGYGDQAGGQPHWIVRQSRDGGRTWSTIDDFTYGFSARAFAIVSTSNGLFVAGSGWHRDRESGECWLVRKGMPDSTGGFDWQTVDELPSGEPGKWSASRASALGVDARGNVYTVGRSLAQPGGQENAHWTVRRAAKEGSEWTVVDAFQLEPGCYAAALGVTVESQGGVYVVGQARRDIGTHWIVRHSATGEAGSWSASDNFRLKAAAQSTSNAASLVKDAVDGMVMSNSPGEYSQGLAIVSDSNAIFTGGSAYADARHAVVRKLELDPPGRLTAAKVP